MQSLVEEISRRDVALSELNAIKTQHRETKTSFTEYKSKVSKDMREAEEKVESLKDHCTSRVQSLEETLLQKDAALSEPNTIRTELHATRAEFRNIRPITPRCNSIWKVLKIGTLAGNSCWTT